jgi:hypothetical protein
MPSINRHFKLEAWLMAALGLVPLAVGIVAAIFFA